MPATEEQKTLKKSDKGYKNPSGHHAFAHLKRTVIDQDLCVHCGLCVGVCPERCISMNDILDDNLPMQTGVCKPCSLCTDVCPGADVDFPALNETFFNQQPESELGNHLETYIGYAQNTEFRQNATAGGVVTTIVAEALNHGIAEGSLVVGREDDAAWKPAVHFAQTEEQLATSAKSTYTLVPVLADLPKALESAGKLIIVALPCQVQALRKLQQLNPEYNEKIACIIGLYCGVQLYFDATKSLLKRFGIETKDYDNIEALDYRAGEWPGHFEVKTKDGQVSTISKAGFNFLAPFYAVPRCWQCIDPTAELADISVGDGWLKEGKDTKGSSVVVVRTEAGRKFLENAKGRLTLEPVTAQETIDMHSHTFSLKRTGSFLRLAIQQGKKPTPNYHLEMPEIDDKRKAFERVNEFLFTVCNTPIARKIIETIPLGFLDWFFTYARKVWQGLSRKKRTS